MLCHASLELILTIAGFWFHSPPCLNLVTTMSSTLDMFSEIVQELAQTNGGTPPTVQQLVDAADLSVADAEEILQSLQDEGLLPPAKKPRKAKTTKPPVEETPAAASEEAAGSSTDCPLEQSKDDEDAAPLANLVPKRLRPYTASKAAVNMDQLETFQDTEADELEDLEEELDKSLEEPPAPAPATPLASAFAKGRLV